MPTSARFQLILIILLTLCLLVSLVGAPYGRDQILQHAPMPIVIPLLMWAARRGWISNAAMTCIVLFLLLHVLGARYTYSNVPYGESLTLFALGDEALGRNHYDRLVHLLFGVLAMWPLVEVAQKYGHLRSGWAWTFAFCVIATVSAAYEVFEWLLTIFAAPEMAKTYNGQQGDFWDAQKDMFLALLGAALVLPLAPFLRRRSASAKPDDS